MIHNLKSEKFPNITVKHSENEFCFPKNRILYLLWCHIVDDKNIIIKKEQGKFSKYSKYSLIVLLLLSILN